MRHHALTEDEIRALPAVVDVPTAGAAFGLSPGATRNQIKAGTFPCRVIVVGRLHRIATAEIRKALGIETAAA